MIQDEWLCVQTSDEVFSRAIPLSPFPRQDLPEFPFLRQLVTTLDRSSDN
jgi:hypothetical protein